MAVAYFDSSVLLSFLLQEPRADSALAIWEGHSQRVSSILLGAECWTSMRRHFTRNRINPPAGWLEERSAVLSDVLASVNLMPVDEDVLSILKDRAELAECKTLDALHLATALIFASKGDEQLIIASLDEKMRQTAKKLKLDVLPA